MTLTQQRSEAMLFIEGFVATDFQFLTRKNGLEDQIARRPERQVDRGQQRFGSGAVPGVIREKYGFTIAKYGKNADAFQAVLSGREDAAISGDGNVMYAAAQNPQFAASYRVVDGQCVFVGLPQG